MVIKGYTKKIELKLNLIEPSGLRLQYGRKHATVAETPTAWGTLLVVSGIGESFPRIKGGDRPGDRARRPHLGQVQANMPRHGLVKRGRRLLAVPEALSVHAALMDGR